MGGFFGDASVFFQIFLPEFFNRGRVQPPRGAIHPTTSPDPVGVESILAPFPARYFEVHFIPFTLSEFFVIFGDKDISSFG